MPQPQSSVQDLRASYEARNKATAGLWPHFHFHRHRHHHEAGDLTNMSSSQKRSATVPKAAPAASIDAVLDTKPAQSHPAPNAATRPSPSNRPSWIGPKPPDRPLSPALKVMKFPVTVDFSSPGLQPPVFVCTSLSDPPWEPVEMETMKNDKDEYRFFKSFTAEEGDYQYKLRLGPGDWWVCDDSKPSVDDGAGNKNNLVTIKAESKPDSLLSTTPVEQPKQTNQSPVSSSASTAPFDAGKVPPIDGKPSHEPPGLVEARESTHVAPLMEHEVLSSANVAASGTKKQSLFIPAECAGDISDDDALEEAPLLRHESLVPSSIEQIHAPLFRHENTAIDDKQHEELSSVVLFPVSLVHSDGDPVPPEADPDDPTLEKFPTTQNGILEHIHHTAKVLAEDGTLPLVDRSTPPSAVLSITSSTGSLPSVQEDEELKPLQPLTEETQQGSEIETMEGIFSQPDSFKGQRKAIPITPPMTPEEQDELGEHEQQELEELVEHVAAHVEEDEVKEAVYEKMLAEEMQGSDSSAM